MILPDVNVLVYAYRKDTEDHSAYHRWLQDVVNGDEAYGLSDIALSGFIRIVTHPRVFKQPSALNEALVFVRQLRDLPHCVSIAPGPRHWGIFLRLCSEASVKGNLVPDAYYAAMAIESACEWITTDRDFGRFPGLRWRHPLVS